MNAFERFLIALQATMTTPEAYGAFHLTAIALVALATIFLCVFARNCKDRTFRGILLVFWVAIVLFETYKQLIFSVSADVDKAIWQYTWASFPFQFCDTPFYILPLAIFLKEGKVRDAAMAFLSTYALLAGILVMFYPGDVFTTTIGVNIHTMFHHGTQVILGIFIASYNRKKLAISSFLRAMLIFIVMVTIAQVMNFVVHNYITDEQFNMYFISPYFHREYPIVGALGEKWHWALITLVYTAGFSAIAFLFYLAERGLARLFCKKENKVS